jgi:hypothetical protein
LVEGDVLLHGRLCADLDIPVHTALHLILFTLGMSQQSLDCRLTWLLLGTLQGKDT